MLFFIQIVSKRASNKKFFGRLYLELKEKLKKYDLHEIRSSDFGIKYLTQLFVAKIRSFYQV